MVVLIAGASHTGKTNLAQKLLEKYRYPYFSVDHLKMGLIRSGMTSLTPADDEKLTPFLWKIVKEMIKTVIENHQNLIVEGCYIPFDYVKDFEEVYLSEIRYICLVMSENYIRSHFCDIRAYANVVETRLDDSECTLDSVLEDNRRVKEACEKYALPYVFIDDTYSFDIQL